MRATVGLTVLDRPYDGLLQLDHKLAVLGLESQQRFLRIQPHPLHHGYRNPQVSCMRCDFLGSLFQHRLGGKRLRARGKTPHQESGNSFTVDG